VARFCVPALLFRAISRQPIHDVLHGDSLAVYAGGSLLALGTVTLFALRVRGRPLSLAAMQGLGASGSNSSFVGYPIVFQVIGPAAGVGLALCTLVENLLVMPLALALSDAGGHDRRAGKVVSATARGLVRNQMIWAIAAGVVFSALGLKLPGVLDRTVARAAAAAPPTALFVSGGSLVGLHLAGQRGDLALVSGGKLLLQPLCVLGLVLLFPLQDPALRAAAVLFAAMPMPSIYPVLAQRHGHERFCAAALLVTTVSSFVTISAFVGAIPAHWVGDR
jgi:predicted permease